MELPTLFVFTHDAMGDGEDGPTHQPVEHLASLRAIPGLVTLRPADANEVSRGLPLHRATASQAGGARSLSPTSADIGPDKYASAAGVARGRYILADAPGNNPELILIASGSEVSLAVQAHEKLIAEGIRSRVVSIPSWDIFEHQTQEYRDAVLPSQVKARVAIEQASTFDGSDTSARRVCYWNENIWGVGAAKRASEKVRLRAGPGGDDRKGFAR